MPEGRHKPLNLAMYAVRFMLLTRKRWLLPEKADTLQVTLGQCHRQFMSCERAGCIAERVYCLLEWKQDTVLEAASLQPVRMGAWMLLRCLATLLQDVYLAGRALIICQHLTNCSIRLSSSSPTAAGEPDGTAVSRVSRDAGPGAHVLRWEPSYESYDARIHR
jgi:hypothetical protein